MVRHLIRGWDSLRRAFEQHPPAGDRVPTRVLFAQQGSIYVFVVLIFVYVYLMNRLDREFGVDEDAE